MKNTFAHYLQVDNKFLEDLWSECYIVLDTNILLDFFRLPEKIRDELFEALSQIQDKLWLPYQVGDEFFRNIPNIQNDVKKDYEEFIQIIKKFQMYVNTNSDPKQDKLVCWALSAESKKHLFDALNRCENELKKDKKEKIEFLRKSDILEKIDNLFKNKIGAPYNEQQLKIIRKEGKKRFSKGIPPGYEDFYKSKPLNSVEKNNLETQECKLKPYGDLVIWKQLIEKAKSDKKNIIFITRDAKEDWWSTKSGHYSEPRTELRKEFFDLTGRSFYIYKRNGLIQGIRRFLNVNSISDETVKELNKYDNDTVAFKKINNRSVLGGINSRSINSMAINSSSNALDQMRAAQAAQAALGISSVLDKMKTNYPTVADLAATTGAFDQMKAAQAALGISSALDQMRGHNFIFDNND